MVTTAAVRHRFSRTIAARNAQVRKARQPVLLTAREELAATDALPRTSETPLDPIDGTIRAAERHIRPRNSSDDVPMPRQTPLVPLHEVRHAETPTRASVEPSDIIIISSDSDEVEAFSTACMHESTDTRHRASSFGPETHEQQMSSSEQALQQLFDRNHDFYESLDREMARIAATRSMSEVSSSSLVMESLVPDASTSYETSSWAPTRSMYSHEAPPPANPLYHGQRVPMYAPQSHYERSRPGTTVSPAFAYDAAGNLAQYSSNHYGAWPAPPLYPHTGPHAGYMILPSVGEASHVWDPADALSSRPAFDHTPDDHQYTQIPRQPSYLNPYQSMYLQNQRGDLLPADPSSSAADLERAKLASYRRPRSPRQAQEDKAKADMVYKALRGASKRARTKSTAQARQSPKGKEPEWSTLKASRTEADGTLSLTAALRRPLPATRLAQASRGGSRLSLPLYRSLGSSAEDRRRAEDHLHDTSSKQRRSESSSASTSKSAPEATRAIKLFRPSPLTESEQYGRRR
ncbi:hypothetical protein PHSY_007261 [Pseudozyma hubeiensis SY62]|uniref:Uncharacterized protein n=1 Tax=Pseudozyma hubeiensis (strain SY62) TaxID=1305764 RepID=R9PE55_PSEHS|nr:hypothetical protein PHSY_007261 [Pseudozyma hubeiensis SY62]GAC99658.1 hypothetical protein PHSY_007261 [Pseudozyma hubeiensis SY62]